MKILCICRNGNVRSVALAYLIKTIYGHDALACGIKKIGPDTKRMLFDWADKVFVLDKELLPEVMKDRTSKFGRKVRVVHVGDDHWFNPKDQELLHNLYKQLNNLGL